jgi:cytochrome c
VQRSALALALALATEAAAGADGDPARGEQLYARCQACHALAYDRVGPRHCGLLGRRAGSVPGFGYSAAMMQSGIVWTAKALDRFLAAPLGVVPGTTMTYAGVADPKERADLIAFLKRESAAMKCAPAPGSTLRR